jgi:hypothetical protein
VVAGDLTRWLRDEEAKVQDEVVSAVAAHRTMRSTSAPGACSNNQAPHQAQVSSPTKHPPSAVYMRCAAESGRI